MKFRKPTKKEVIRATIISWAISLTVAVGGIGYAGYQALLTQDLIAQRAMTNSFYILMIVQALQGGQK